MRAPIYTNTCATSDTLILCNARAQCYLCVTMVLTCKGFRHAQHLSRHILLLHNNMVYVCVQGGSSK